MKVGLLLSAGGSPFFSAADILMESGDFKSSDFFVIVDRTCGAEERCREAGIECVKLEERDRVVFSQKCARLFSDRKCDLIILIFARLVSSELFDRFATLNIHPSLLPSFPGFNATKNALKSHVKFLGATLHLVDEGVDTGPIAGQVVSPVLEGSDLPLLERASYLQKTYLTLLAIDLFSQGVFVVKPGERRKLNWVKPTKASASCNPKIQTDRYLQGFARLQSSLGMEDLLI